MTIWPLYAYTVTPRRALWNKTVQLWMRIPSGTLVLLGLLVIAGLVHGLQMTVTPALVTTDDEGTYVAQAWAILHMGQLAHYTYWYDHPPLGWIQLAGWAWLTHAFERYDSAIAVGREFMLVMKLASVALMYVVSRRLGMNRFFASIAVLLFALTPLGLYFQRLTYLDNITVTWVLAAFALALSPRHKMSAFIMSALCFGIAVLTKETILVIAPALIYQLWQGTRNGTGLMSRVLWFVVLSISGLFYVGMAAIKHELVPGPNHVDLWTAIKWQLAGRDGSGSIFDETSPANFVVKEWARLDPWLIGLSALAVVITLFVRRLRPVGLALIIQLLMMLRAGGYLPKPYVIALIPFSAIVLAGVLHALSSTAALNWFRFLRRQIPKTGYSFAQILPKIPVVALIAIFIATIAGPRWTPQLEALVTDDRNVSVRAATAWVKDNVEPTKPDGSPARILVSDAMWVDLTQMGFFPDWYYKVDLDPAVKANYPHGWEDVSYVIYTNEMNELGKTEQSRNDTPTVIGARDHGTLVASYGSGEESIWIYKVGAQV